MLLSQWQLTVWENLMSPEALFLQTYWEHKKHIFTWPLPCMVIERNTVHVWVFNLLFGKSLLMFPALLPLCCML